MLLIGSRALLHTLPDARPGRDWDMLARRNDVLAWMEREGGRISHLVPSRPGKDRARMTDGTSIEIEDIDVSASALLLDALPGLEVSPTPLGPARVIPPTYLAAIKRSHAQWPIHWRKTVGDLHWMRGRLGGDERADPEVLHFFDVRRGEHIARFGARSSNLAMSNDEFFGKSASAVQREHQHDDLHLAVAYGARPMFERFKHDASRAALDKGLWLQASQEDRLRAVREEAMVIALERRIIPALPESADAYGAYAWAVQRLATTLTSGWFRDFVIDQWPSVREPDVDYVNLYLRAFPTSGGVGPH